MTQPIVVTYTDELLADRSVHRRYSDGRQEWRRRIGDGVVEWRDDRGGYGTDELLGRGIVKRTNPGRRPVYARELGYGRTCWSGNLVTVNRSSFGGRVGIILAGMGAAALLPAIVPPPDFLSPADEEALRQAEAQRQQSSSSDGGDDGDSDWSDDSDGDDDFG
jgi:hypothetical protein